jgi:glutaredoxin
MLKVYSAEWCQPCKTLKKMLTDNKIEFTVIDIDKEPEVSRKAVIMGLPTIVNETGDRLVGAVTLDQITSKLL